MFWRKKVRAWCHGIAPQEAHRSHAYQHAAITLGNHRSVTLTVAVINVFWLPPWALAIAAGWVAGMVGLMVAYVPSVVLALRFRAGMR